MKKIPGIRHSRCCFHCRHGRYPSGISENFLNGFHCFKFDQEVEPIQDCPEFAWYLALGDGQKMVMSDGSVNTGEPFVTVEGASRITGSSEKMVDYQLKENSDIGVMVKGKWRIPVKNLHMIKPTKIYKEKTKCQKS